jgi:hypothetical protein
MRTDEMKLPIVGLHQNKKASYKAMVRMPQRPSLNGCTSPGMVAWWPISVIPELGRLRQEDNELQAN